MLGMLANSADLSMIVLPLGGFVWSFCHPEPGSSLQLEDELRVRVHLPKDTTLDWLEMASCLCGGVLKHHPGPYHVPQGNPQIHSQVASVPEWYSLSLLLDSEVKHFPASRLYSVLLKDLSSTSNCTGNRSCGRDTSASQAEDTWPEKDA